MCKNVASQQHNMFYILVYSSRENGIPLERTKDAVATVGMWNIENAGCARDICELINHCQYRQSL